MNRLSCDKVGLHHPISCVFMLTLWFRGFVTHSVKPGNQINWWMSERCCEWAKYLNAATLMFDFVSGICHPWRKENCEQNKNFEAECTITDFHPMPASTWWKDRDRKKFFCPMLCYQQEHQLPFYLWLCKWRVTPPLTPLPHYGSRLQDNCAELWWTLTGVNLSKA